MPYDYDPNNPYGAGMPRHYIVGQSCRNMKRLARQTLKGHWGEAILAAFIMEAIMSGPRLLLGALAGNGGFISFLSDLYSVVIVGPANVGLMMFFLGIFRMDNPEKRIIYRGFQSKEMFFKGLLVYCSMMIRIIFWSFLFVIPGIIASFRFSMSFRILCDHPEYTPGECLAASSMMMKGNKLKFFILQLSFWFWALLAGLPRGISAEMALQGVPNLQALMTDLSVFSEYMNKYLSNPWMLLSYALGVILNVYIQMAGCCFYDLAAGNLVVKQANTGDETYGDQ